MIRARIADDFGSLGIAIAIVRHTDGDNPTGRMILRLAPHGEGDLAFGVSGRWDPIEPGGMITPTLRLGQEEAHALRIALNNHFQGVDDDRALRADYTAERGRVDRLIGVVCEIAQRSTAP